jgi:uncharacterized Rossmann fold enzyme
MPHGDNVNKLEKYCPVLNASLRLPRQGYLIRFLISAESALERCVFVDRELGANKLRRAVLILKIQCKPDTEKKLKLAKNRLRFQIFKSETFN